MEADGRVSDTIRRQLLVRGRVQGVGFRYFTRLEAERLGLTGFVRNLRDGGVEAEAQGPTEDVNRLTESVRQGPPGSRVDGVNVLARPVRENEEGFRIETTI